MYRLATKRAKKTNWRKATIHQVV